MGKNGDSVPNLRMDIYGDGEYRRDLIELRDELGLTDRVTFSDGFISFEALSKALEGAHLALIPSRNIPATKLMLPVKILEYVCLGIPCITVATPTIRHYFDESSVRFFPAEDHEALAEQNIDLYHDPEGRLRLARHARTFYDTYNFATDRESYLGVLHRLAGN